MPRLKRSRSCSSTRSTASRSRRHHTLSSTRGRRSPRRSKEAEPSRSPVVRIRTKAARVAPQAEGVGGGGGGGGAGERPPNVAEAPPPKPGPDGKAGLAGLGNLVELQKRLAEERRKLQLFVIKAKQDHEDRQDVVEDWEHEYCKPAPGQPCGATGEFVAEKELGKGVFATVFHCRRSGPEGGAYAVKFIRANTFMRKAAEKEISMLRKIRDRCAKWDEEGARYLLGLVGCETFEHERHLALVFELMKCDLRTGLKKYGQGGGLPLFPTLRSFAKNIFSALRALQRINVIHGDVKPDNLLMSLDKSEVKLCDFGSAMDASDHIRTDYIQPRYYRAPEVILGQDYDTQVDVWSAGTTLFELATGLILFRGGSNNEMVHEMLKTVGGFGLPFASAGDFASKHFTDNGDFLNAKGDFRTNSVNAAVLPMARFRPPPRPLLQLLRDMISKPPAALDASDLQPVLQIFADLLASCLRPDPARRSTPERALGHHFFAPSADLLKEARKPGAPGRGETSV